MYLIDHVHVAELRFVNRFIYAIKRIYTHTTFPQYFGFHSIFWTSLRQFLVTQDRILPIRRAADRSTQSRQDNWIVGIPV